jgi:hypothetical protein
LLLPWPDNVNYDQELVGDRPDALSNWAFLLVGVVLWIGVPAVFWAGMIAWFAS